MKRVLLFLCAGLVSCAGAKSRKFLTQTRLHRTIALMPAVFSVFDSPSASDLFDPPPRKKPYKPLTWKAASKSCANCEAYAFELQNTIHRLLTANSEKYRVVLLSLDDTNARLENRFFKMENLTHKKASELAQELDVDALLVPTVGLSYRLEPNVEIPFMLPLSSGTTLGPLGLVSPTSGGFPAALKSNCSMARNQACCGVLVRKGTTTFLISKCATKRIFSSNCPKYFLTAHQQAGLL